LLLYGIDGNGGEEMRKRDDGATRRVEINNQISK